MYFRSSNRYGMEYSILDLLKLLGSLGFFLYGMKLMSESLQKVAGDRMRNILAAMTSNRFRGVLTGLTITAIIQSSSATTVMLVSFVNAGLITVAESIGVVMGSNIGTTATAWLITALGFKVHMGDLTLILIGLSLPLLFSKNAKKSNWGSVIIGFSIIFIGLDFLKASTPDINNNPQIFEFLTQFSNHGYGSVMIFLALGTLLTMVIQSSSAVMALMLVMCFNGWISFEMAAAMVLGQNIGTTVTAILASLVANTSAKRTAMAHLVFNVIGVILALLIFYPSLHLVEVITIKAGFLSPFQQAGQDPKATAEVIPIALAIYHTIFNLLNTFILIWFVPQLENLVTRLVKQKDENEEEFNLRYINTGLLSTVELSILQARKEIDIYMSKVNKMFHNTAEISTIAYGKEYHKLYDKIKKREEHADNMEVEIANYLIRITSELNSTSSAEEINSMLVLISNIESIADACYGIANAIDRKKEQKFTFIKEVDENIKLLFELNEKMLVEVLKDFDGKEGRADLNITKQLYEQQSKLLVQIQKEHYKNLKKGAYKVKIGVVYSDIYNEFDNMKEYIYKVAKTKIPHESIMQ